MRIAIEASIFERFPSYRRGLVVARGIRNDLADAELEGRLRKAEATVRQRLGDGWKDDPRLAVWLEAFRELGMNPNQRPPAVAALVKRVSKGSSLPFINAVVALMNVTSLEHLAPCGGDDLAAVEGDLTLRPATGTERYRPLGAPDRLDPPDPGELILVDEGGQVLCRGWCWRNSDTTKLADRTTAVALNLDLMGSVVSLEEAQGATERLAADLQRHCGGEVEWRLLTAEHPVAESAL